VSNEDW